MKKLKLDAVWKVYKFALAGLSNKDIGDQLGICEVTFVKILRSKPVLQRAIIAARIDRKSTARVSCRDFVFGRLPPKLQNYWSYLEDEESMGRHDGEINEASRKLLFLHAWYVSDFSITEALAKVGITRRAFCAWKEIDAEFEELCDQMLEVRKDFVESSVMKLIREGDSAAAVRTNIALNRDRGYSPKVEMDVNIQANIKVHGLEELNLPFEVRKEILHAMRELRAIPVNNSEFTLPDPKPELTLSNGDRF